MLIRDQGDGWFVGNLYVETYYLRISGAQLYLIYHYVFVPCYMLESESASSN